MPKTWQTSEQVDSEHDPVFQSIAATVSNDTESMGIVALELRDSKSAQNFLNS